VAVLLLFTACSHSYDAYFANPCGRPLTVRTYYVVRGTEDKSEDLIATALVNQLTVTKVKDAFQDANGFIWWVEVEGQSFKVLKDTMPRWTFTIPATVCGK
jgi:hypothetical protein